MDILSKEQEKKNREKYGEKHFDVISDMYRIGKKEGEVYCGGNALKYIKRFIGKSSKAENPMDIEKAIDYLNRIKEKLAESNIVKEEVIDK